MLRWGADSEAQDNCGRTAAHYVIYSGRAEILSLLVDDDNQALVHITDNAKRTPLHHAVFLETS